MKNAVGFSRSYSVFTYTSSNYKSDKTKFYSSLKEARNAYRTAKKKALKQYCKLIAMKGKYWQTVHVTLEEHLQSHGFHKRHSFNTYPI